MKASRKFYRRGFPIRWIIVLFMVVCLPLWASVASLSGYESFCADTIIAHAGNESLQAYEARVHPEAFEASTQFLQSVTKDCPSPIACTTEQVVQASERALDSLEIGKVSLLRKILRWPRRMMVATIWGASVLGPGIISYYVTSRLPMELRIPVTNFVMVMSMVVFSRFSSPIEKKISPMVEQFAFWLWDPAIDDGYGQIMKRLNEPRRLQNSQVYNQLDTFRSFLYQAAGLLKRNDVEMSALFYVRAFLHSRDMFAALHLETPATFREVRANLGWIEDVPVERRKLLVETAVRIVDYIPDEEMGQPPNTEELKKIIKYVLSKWMSI